MARTRSLDAHNRVLEAALELFVERGIEPTYPLVIAQCPNASVNPETGEVVNKRVIYSIFESRCYDEDPESPWTHGLRSSKHALTETEIAKRLAFGKHMESLKHYPAGWGVRGSAGWRADGPAAGPAGTRVGGSASRWVSGSASRRVSWPAGQQVGGAADRWTDGPVGL